MVKCSFFMCDSHTHKNTPGITFHRFPQDKELKKIWLKKMKQYNWEPKFHSVLCSRHFKSHLLDTSEFYTRLRPGAIPTIFQELPPPQEDVTKNYQSKTMNAEPKLSSCSKLRNYRKVKTNDVSVLNTLLPSHGNQISEPSIQPSPSTSSTVNEQTKEDPQNYILPDTMTIQGQNESLHLKNNVIVIPHVIGQITSENSTGLENRGEEKGRVKNQVLTLLSPFVSLYSGGGPNAGTGHEVLGSAGNQCGLEDENILGVDYSVQAYEGLTTVEKEVPLNIISKNGLSSASVPVVSHITNPLPPVQKEKGDSDTESASERECISPPPNYILNTEFVRKNATKKPKYVRKKRKSRKLLVMKKYGNRPAKKKIEQKEKENNAELIATRQEIFPEDTKITKPKHKKQTRKRNVLKTRRPEKQIEQKPENENNSQFEDTYTLTPYPRRVRRRPKNRHLEEVQQKNLPKKSKTAETEEQFQITPEDVLANDEIQDDKYQKLKEAVEHSIIYRVYEYLLNEYNELKCQVSCELICALSDVLSRAAAATGVTAQTLQRILLVRGRNVHAYGEMASVTHVATEHSYCQQKSPHNLRRRRPLRKSNTLELEKEPESPTSNPALVENEQFSNKPLEDIERRYEKPRILRKRKPPKEKTSEMEQEPDPSPLCNPAFLDDKNFTKEPLQDIEQHYQNFGDLQADEMCKLVLKCEVEDDHLGEICISDADESTVENTAKRRRVKSEPTDEQYTQMDASSSDRPSTESSGLLDNVKTEPDEQHLDVTLDQHHNTQLSSTALTMDDLRCINCTIKLTWIRRHSVGSDEILTILQQWLAPQQVTENSLLCHNCWLLVNLTAVGQRPDTRSVGHTDVCVHCGCSVRRIRKHLLRTDTEKERKIRTVIVNWCTPGSVRESSCICHPCWQRAERALTPISEASPSANMAIDEVVVNPQEPAPPLPKIVQKASPDNRSSVVEDAALDSNMDDVKSEPTEAHSQLANQHIDLTLSSLCEDTALHSYMDDVKSEPTEAYSQLLHDEHIDFTLVVGASCDMSATTDDYFKEEHSDIQRSVTN